MTLKQLSTNRVVVWPGVTFTHKVSLVFIGRDVRINPETESETCIDRQFSHFSKTTETAQYTYFAGYLGADLGSASCLDLYRMDFKEKRILENSRRHGRRTRMITDSVLDHLKVYGEDLATLVSK
ncbi:unnamed protein product [Nippostrongylus brasiliensis]|uniref:ULP_PROTEASE domain-containing protein n=1 Tax=Nippostrongylus brasiliensis TaxID=27835 RepID=A0A0N4XZE0_NIPBR|nr:unnamed protein product [Nippostrongylus brasiliensis]